MLVRTIACHIQALLLGHARAPCLRFFSFLVNAVFIWEHAKDPSVRIGRWTLLATAVKRLECWKRRARGPGTPLATVHHGGYEV